MRDLFQFLLGIACILFTSAQLSAQCFPNTMKEKNKAQGAHVFANESFGQSIKTGACAAGTFESFTFFSQGNSPTKMNLTIYAGDGITGDKLYEQENISLPPANMGGGLTVDIEGGTEYGSGLSISPNTFYTFYFTMTGGNLIAHAVQDDTNDEGRAYFKSKKRTTNSTETIDLRFEIEAAEPAELTCDNDSGFKITVEKVVGETIYIKVQKTSGGFTYYPPNTGGTTMAFDNVKASLTRADGVGPQTGKKTATWIVQRIKASSPAVIKFVNNVCENKSLILLE